MNTVDIEEKIYKISKQLRFEQAMNRINMGYILINTFITVGKYLKS